MRYDGQIENELDSLMCETDILRFDRRLDIVEVWLRERRLMVFYDELDPRRKLHIATDRLTALLAELERSTGWEGYREPSDRYDPYAEWDN
jgi:hypothetical protein